MSSLLERVLAGITWLLPHHLLTAMARGLSQCRVRWFKNLFIRSFARLAGINWQEAVSQDVHDYACFNAFFTRALKPGARPLPDDPQALLSPCDGRISALGAIDGDQVFQAKGRSYSLAELLADDPRTEQFAGGSFITIYLSPRDYHRVHAPLAGQLSHLLHVPGRLFSVSPASVRQVDRLFARNERIACFFDGPHGAWAQLMVGALLVGSMSTAWQGQINPPRARQVVRHEPSGPVALAAGDPFGHFNYGSTVICLFPPGAVTFSPELIPGTRLLQGQVMGRQQASGH